MSYNILAETDKPINWEKLNGKVVIQVNVEYVPMPGMGVNGGDALGISIPSKNIKKGTWQELETVINILIKEYKFELYDMYYGTKVKLSYLEKIKENLSL